MKKNNILYFALFLSNLIFSQEVFNERTMIKEYKQIKKTAKKSTESIKKIDTIFISRNKELPQSITKYFDIENRLIKIHRIDPNSYDEYEAEKNGIKRRLKKLKGGREEYYDSNGNLILIKNEDIDGVIWQLTINEYNDKNRLTKKWMFDLKNIYKTVYEYLDENDKPIEHYFDVNGNNITSENYNGKRKYPYK